MNTDMRGMGGMGHEGGKVYPEANKVGKETRSSTETAKTDALRIVTQQTLKDIRTGAGGLAQDSLANLTSIDKSTHNIQATWQGALKERLNVFENEKLNSKINTLGPKLAQQIYEEMQRIDSPCKNVQELYDAAVKKQCAGLLELLISSDIVSSSHEGLMDALEPIEYLLAYQEAALQEGEEPNEERTKENFLSLNNVFNTEIKKLTFTQAKMIHREFEDLSKKDFSVSPFVVIGNYEGLKYMYDSKDEQLIKNLQELVLQHGTPMQELYALAEKEGELIKLLNNIRSKLM